VKSQITVIANGDKKEISGIQIEAIPMYNLTPDRLKFHTKGRGNVMCLPSAASAFTSAAIRRTSGNAPAQKYRCGICLHESALHHGSRKSRERSPGIQTKIVYPYHYAGAICRSSKSW